MVEQDTAAGEQAVALSVVLGDPVAVQLRYAVRAAGVERSRLALWDCLYQAEHLGSGSLIETSTPALRHGWLPACW